ncbi:MAG: leucine-rich repeat domain-containing protein [Candidatus Sigynarchaeota archaeon]
MSVSENALTSLDGIQYLHSLERLDAVCNQIDSIRSDILSGLNHLQVLDLSYNKIDYFPALEGVPALWNLILNSNKLTRPPVLPEMLRHERCYIDARGNPIKDVTEEEAQFILAFGPQEDPALVDSSDWWDDKLIEFLYWDIRGNLKRCAELYTNGRDDEMKEYIATRELMERRRFELSHHFLSPFALNRLKIYASEETHCRWARLREEALARVRRDKHKAGGGDGGSGSDDKAR